MKLVAGGRVSGWGSGEAAHGKASGASGMSGSVRVATRRGVEVEDEVVGEGGGEDEGRAFDGQDDVGLEEAGDVGGVGGAERGRNGGLDGGQADDDDGFGLWKEGAVLRRRLRASCLRGRRWRGCTGIARCGGCR